MNAEPRGSFDFTVNHEGIAYKVRVDDDRVDVDAPEAGIDFDCKIVDGQLEDHTYMVDPDFPDPAIPDDVIGEIESWVNSEPVDGE